MRRVVVSGLGVATGFGDGAEPFWSGLSQGRSCVQRIRSFPCDKFPVQVASEAGEASLDAWLPEMREEVVTRPARLALTAAKEAWMAAKLPLEAGAPPQDSFGLAASIGWGAYDLRELLLPVLPLCARRKDPSIELLTEEIRKNLRPHFYERVCTGFGEALLAGAFRLGGPRLSCLSACAASTQVIGDALRCIRRGEAELMLAGGADSRVHPLGILGYHSLGVLTTRFAGEPHRASRPFAADRGGMVVGEGAGFLVFESLEHAQRRGAPILAELLAGASTCVAVHITDPQPDGRAAAACMSLCVERAGLHLREVDWINGHGSATAANDRMETRAVKRAFGAHAPRVPITSLKSMMGHLALAAGAVELIGGIQAMRHGLLPPTINLEAKDPECDLDYVPNKPRRADIRCFLKNSFGFGGQNASLAVRRWEGA